MSERKSQRAKILGALIAAGGGEVPVSNCHGSACSTTRGRWSSEDSGFAS